MGKHIETHSVFLHKQTSKQSNNEKVEILGNNGHLTLEKLSICATPAMGIEIKERNQRQRRKGFFWAQKCYDVSRWYGERTKRISNIFKSSTQSSHFGKCLKGFSASFKSNVWEAQDESFEKTRYVCRFIHEAGQRENPLKDKIWLFSMYLKNFFFSPVVLSIPTVR